MSESERPEPFIDPIDRFLTIGGRAMTLRQERTVWDAFDEICQREDVAPESLCERIDSRPGTAGLAEKIADFVTRYFKDAASHDPSPHRGMSDGNGGEPEPGPALRRAFDAVGPDPKKP